ncbi:MAG TPA: hypothetical protein VGG13_03235 [Candidatus Saccharimonadales bacterium]
MTLTTSGTPQCPMVMKVGNSSTSYKTAKSVNVTTETAHVGPHDAVTCSDPKTTTISLSNTYNSVVPPPSGSGNGKEPELQCTILSFNPLNWFICPLVDAAQSAVNDLTSAIDSMLTVNTSATFGSNPTGDGFKSAWSTFRLFAIGIIIIAGLIMLIAQGLGMDFIDAYTIRKILPRMVVMIIFITLSWYVLEFLIGLSNDVGNGIRYIIYQPFTTSKYLKDTVNVGNGATSVGFIVGAAGILALGLIGLLSFALTAFVALLVAFVVLIVRKIVIIMLVIMAPLALACYILPNTEKVWQFWRDTLISMLIVFPIISAMIAAGRVFAVVTYNSPGNATVNQITAFIAYFLPYLLLPMAFKFAGGTLGAIHGVVRDKSGGLHTGLSKFRRGQAANRFNQAREDRGGFVGANALGKVYRRATLGGNMLTGRGRRKYAGNVQKMRLAGAAKTLQEDEGFTSGDDDANELAAQVGMTRGRFVDAYMGRGYTNTQAQAALGRLEVGYGAQMGSGAMQVAAFKAAGASNGAYDRGDLRANQAAIYGAAAPLVAAGLMSESDAAGVIKSNPARPDYSATGWGSTIGQVAASTAAYQGGARGIDLVTEDQSRSLRNEIQDESNAGAVLGGHFRAVRALAPGYLDRYNEAKRSGDRREVEKQAATIMGMYDRLGNESKTKQTAFGQQVLGAGVIGKDGTMITVRKDIEELRERAPDARTGEQGVLERRRELGVREGRDPNLHPPEDTQGH